MDKSQIVLCNIFMSQQTSFVVLSIYIIYGIGVINYLEK